MSDAERNLGEVGKSRQGQDFTGPRGPNKDLDYSKDIRKIFKDFNQNSYDTTVTM